MARRLLVGRLRLLADRGSVRGNRAFGKSKGSSRRPSPFLPDGSRLYLTVNAIFRPTAWLPELAKPIGSVGPIVDRSFGPRFLGLILSLNPVFVRWQFRLTLLRAFAVRDIELTFSV